jgi:outer membrane immunogenic protein
MKKLLLGTVALAALGMGAPAVAADMGVRPAARYVAATNWTGCYVGGSVGNAWGHSDGYSAGTATFNTVTGAQALPGTPLSNDFSLTGFTGGVYGGCNIQLGVFVVGAEGDWEAINKEGQAFFPGGPSVSTVPIIGGTEIVRAGNFHQAQERWLATARGRLGYAVDKWLFFASGGAAWMKVDTSFSHTSFVGLGAGTAGINRFNFQSDRRTGWTVGGGVEYALPYNWSIRSEYLYVQIPSYTTFSPGVNPVFGFHNIIAGKLTDHILRAGLTYKFF